MKKIKKVEGILKVRTVGVFNHNGTEKKFVDGVSFSLKGAKLFKDEDGSLRDYTSHDCFRYHSFYDLVPNQPTTLDVINYQTDIFASEVGIFRGFLAASKNANQKRDTCVYIGDFISEKSGLLVEEVSTNSVNKADEKEQNKEEHEKTNSKRKDGDDVLDAKKSLSLRHSHNAPSRIQTAEFGIDFQKMQFMSQANDRFCVDIKKDTEVDFLSKLSLTLKKLGCKDLEVSISKCCLKTAIVKTPLNGILFNEEQMKVLAKASVERFTKVSARKNGASFKTLDNEHEFELTLEDGSRIIVVGSDNLVKEIEERGIQSFYDTKE